MKKNAKTNNASANTTNNATANNTAINAVETPKASETSATEKAAKESEKAAKKNTLTSEQRDAIKTANDRAKAESKTLSAIVTNIVSSNKNMPNDDRAKMLIRDIIVKGAGDFDASEENATKSEKAAYLRGLKALYPYVFRAENGAITFADPIVCGKVSVNGRDRIVYRFEEIPTDKWNTAKAFTRAATAYLRDIPQRAVSVGVYYLDNLGKEKAPKQSGLKAELSRYNALKEQARAEEKARKENALKLGLELLNKQSETSEKGNA